MLVQSALGIKQYITNNILHNIRKIYLSIISQIVIYAKQDKYLLATT